MSTRAQLLSEIAAQFPDNTTGAITPAKLRQVTEDIANSCAVPAAGTGTITAADITDLAEGREPLLTGTPAQALSTLGTLPSFTAAQLNALTTGNRPLVAWCSDCLVPEGVGSPVVWNGTAWVCTCTSFPVVTEWIDYFRAEFNRGGSFSNQAGCGLMETYPFTGIYSAFSSTTAQNSGSTDIQQIPQAGCVCLRQYGSLLNSGARLIGAAIKGTNVAARYFRVKHIGGNDSTVANAWNWRLSMGSGGYTLGALEVGIAYDPQNALGGLNAGGSANYLSYVRSGSVNTSINVSSVALSVDQSGGVPIEAVLIPGVSFSAYANGVLIATVTSAIPATTDSLSDCVCFNRSSSDGSARASYMVALYRSVRYTSQLI